LFLDLSTFLGIFGVVLTIAFFIIGYRQTIGARQEPARAANKALVDSLLRRLIQEPEFSIPRRDIPKLLSGWALDARIHVADMLSIYQLESLLYAKVIESDYVTGENRKAFTTRLDRFFALEESSTELEASTDTSSVRTFRAEAFLGLASGVVGIITSLVAGFLASPRLNGTVFNKPEFVTTFLVIGGLVAATVAALLFFVRLRDASRNINDLTAVRGLASLVRRMEEGCREDGFSFGVILSGEPPAPRVAESKSEKIQILGLPEFFKMVASSSSRFKSNEASI
jgi:hypothetical protein